MTYRILISDAIYDTRDCIMTAKALALNEAALLADDTGQTVVCKVFEMGTPRRDALGRCDAPAFYIGQAVATPNSVEWQEGIARVALSRRAAA